MINYFKNILSPNVMGFIEFEQFINITKFPSKVIKETIEKARKLYINDNKDDYDHIKKYCLPCYTFNFLFDGYKKDKNIIKPTGLIYLDMDNQTEINVSHELVHATWRSLSNTGRGIIVKVSNLTKDNFKDTYKNISNELGIQSDTRAMKATQYNVQSYDPEVYYNPNSKIWHTNDSSGISENKLHYSTTYKKDNKDRSELCNNIFWSNLHEMDFNGEPYIIFWEEKFRYAEVFIPKSIPEGRRNSTLAGILSQLKALNPNLDNSDIKYLANITNSSRCNPPLPYGEVMSIANSVISQTDIEVNLNKKRRVIFNPDYEFTKEEKSKIVNEVTGKLKRGKSLLRIAKALAEWSVTKDGKPTISSIANKIGMSRNTVAKYYSEFSFKISEKLKQYKTLK